TGVVPSGNYTLGVAVKLNPAATYELIAIINLSVTRDQLDLPATPPPTPAPTMIPPATPSPVPTFVPNPPPIPVAPVIEALQIYEADYNHGSSPWNGVTRGNVMVDVLAQRPVYLVLSAYEPVQWNLRGNVQNVAGVFVAG